MNEKKPVASHFVPRSIRTQVISYLLWSFRTYVLVISYPVTTISYPGHFVPILVISYLGQLGTKWLHGGQFVSKLFRTLFGHFVPILVISYPAKMDRWIDERTDGQACFDWNDKLTSYSLLLHNEILCHFLKSFNNCQTLLSAPSNTSK